MSAALYPKVSYYTRRIFRVVFQYIIFVSFNWQLPPHEYPHNAFSCSVPHHNYLVHGKIPEDISFFLPGSSLIISAWQSALAKPSQTLFSPCGPGKRNKYNINMKECSEPLLSQENRVFQSQHLPLRLHLPLVLDAGTVLLNMLHALLCCRYLMISQVSVRLMDLWRSWTLDSSSSDQISLKRLM